MTDGNKYYLDKREAEQEEYDFKDEYEEIAADNVGLEAEVKKYHDAWLEAEAQVVDLEAKLAKAVEGLENALDDGMAYSDNRLGYDKAISLLNRLKGEQDD